MRPRTRFRLVFAAAFAAGVLLCGWLVVARSSPFRDFFEGGVLRRLWGVVNLPPLMFAVLVAGNPHSWSESVFFVALVVQWLLVGYLVSGPVSKLKY